MNMRKIKISRTVRLLRSFKTFTKSVEAEIWHQALLLSDVLLTGAPSGKTKELR
jgi:hypothetical protein